MLLFSIHFNFNLFFKNSEALRFPRGANKLISYPALSEPVEESRVIFPSNIFLLFVSSPYPPNVLF
jgi:hypothetical protein